MLMGRSTYGIVEKFGQWHYGKTPVLVATHRPLEPMADTIQTAAGPIQELIERAKEMAGDKDVYLDGGEVPIRHRHMLEPASVETTARTKIQRQLAEDGQSDAA